MLWFKKQPLSQKYPGELNITFLLCGNKTKTYVTWSNIYHSYIQQQTLLTAGIACSVLLLMSVHLTVLATPEKHLLEE